MKAPCLRIIVVGCGAIFSGAYAPVLRKLESAKWIRVVGVVDPDPARRELGCRWFRHCAGFSDLESGLASVDRVDLTIVASPPPLHTKHGLAALRHDSHVLCEKPLSDSSAGIEDLIREASARKRIVAVAMVRRFYPCYRALQRSISQGELGKFARIAVREGGPYSWPVTSAAPFSRSLAGGGVFLDRGVHVLDLLQNLLGDGAIRSFYYDGTDTQVEANCIAHVEYNNAAGFIQLSWDSWLAEGFALLGERHGFWISPSSLRFIYRRTPADSRWVREKCVECWPADLKEARPTQLSPRTYLDCFYLQLVQMLRAILFGDSPPATVTSGQAIVRQLEVAYEKGVRLLKPWE